MHQSYENMEYDASKKYVELSSYTDTTTNNIVAFEVRIFWGNFMETYETEGWYAKSVTFTPDLKVDIYIVFTLFLNGIIYIITFIKI